METRTAIFSKLVGTFMHQVPLAVPTGTPLGDVARRMATARPRKPPITRLRTGIVLMISKRSKAPLHGVSFQGSAF